MRAYQNWLDSLTPFRRDYIEAHNPAETFEAFNAGLEAAAQEVLSRVKEGEGDLIFQTRNANLIEAAKAIRALKDS